MVVKHIKRVWLKAGGIFAAALLYMLLALAGVGCPVRAITGIPCAGCGMTRAILSVLRLDFAVALRYHPLVILIPFILILLTVNKGILKSKKVKAALWLSVAAAFITVYILRLLGKIP